FWPGREAVGRSFRFPNLAGDGTLTEPLRVVGIAKDSKYVTLGEEPIPFIYLPFRQNYTPAMALLVRYDQDPASALTQIRREVAALDPGLPVFNAQPLAAQIEAALFLSRVGAYLLAAFGTLALLLTTVGTYGVIAYTVTRRIPEIGLRMALGAGPGRILRMIVANGMTTVAVGLALGLVASLFLARSMTPVLVGVRGSDPAIYVGITLVLSAVALLACYLPAPPAAGVGPPPPPAPAGAAGGKPSPRAAG